MPTEVATDVLPDGGTIASSPPISSLPAREAEPPVTSIPTITVDKDKVLPLPGWLKKAYFIFPVVLYVPDAIFNFYVYSDGASIKNPNAVIQVGQIALWAFLSIGVVGMAYLLSVLAPWHWGQGHRIQAFFCGLGVIVATAITTWNSLAYRSTGFAEFPTDRWAYGIWPQLQASQISITMILVAIAPPFWGLFWAIVQPTETGRSLRQLQESHAERLLRMQQEAELKRIRAETTAKIREAQLRGMAQTAAAARDQAKSLLTQKPGEQDRKAARPDENTNLTGSTRITEPASKPSAPSHPSGDAHLQLAQQGGSRSADDSASTPRSTRATAREHSNGNGRSAAKVRENAPAAGVDANLRNVHGITYPASRPPTPAPSAVDTLDSNGVTRSSLSRYVGSDS